MLGTNAARVLVVETVGSRSRSNASGSCSAYRRKAGRRRTSQPVANCSIRWRGGQKPVSNSDGQRGAVESRASRRGALAAEVVGQRPPPERNGAQASSSNVTGKARRLILSGAARRRVRMAETPCGSAEAGRGFGTMEGASSRSSIFSRQRRWLLKARGRWNDSGLSVKTDLVRSRAAHGAAAGGRREGADLPVPGDDMGRQRLGRVS